MFCSQQRTKLHSVVDSLLLATPGHLLAASLKDCPSSVPHKTLAIFMQFSSSFLCMFYSNKRGFILFCKIRCKVSKHNIYFNLFFFRTGKNKILILRIVSAEKCKEVFTYLLSSLFY